MSERPFAIQALTGVSLGKRTLKHMDYSKMRGIEPVALNPSWLDGPHVCVFCEGCGEGINYQREVTVRGRTLCRPCRGERYYSERPSGTLRG